MNNLFAFSSYASLSISLGSACARCPSSRVTGRTGVTNLCCKFNKTLKHHCVRTTLLSSSRFVTIAFNNG